jgi:hypothetical protein
VIGVVVQNPQQEDRMYNQEPVARQRKLHFEDDELWTIFPEEVRERCRGLWQEMLASVLKERERRPDERED